MNYSPQTKKSGLHIPAGLIFLFNAIAFGMTLFIPLIEDGFDDLGLTEIVYMFMFVGFTIIAFTFLAGAGKAASAFAFGLIAAGYITNIVYLLTSEYAKYYKFISFVPPILLIIGYLFAIAVCQAGAKRTPGTGAAKLWFIPPAIMLISGIINFINNFDAIKELFDVVFKNLGEIGDTAVALYCIGELIVALMYLIFPIGMFFGMIWVYKTVNAAPAYGAPPYTNPGYVSPQQQYNANPYAYNQPSQGYVPPQQPTYTPPQPSYTPPQQPAYTPPQPPVEEAPEPVYGETVLLSDYQPPMSERKVKGYDPMTGQPIYEDAAPKKIVGYDAMTGAPIYED